MKVTLGEDDLPCTNDMYPNLQVCMLQQIFSTLHLTCVAVTEDIVLGPPKLSFASADANRSRNKYGHDDGTSTGNSIADDDRDIPRGFDRFRNLNRNGDKEQDKGSRGDFRSGFTRRGKDEEGGWTGGKSNKGFNAEDADRFSSRKEGGDRERPSLRDGTNGGGRQLSSFERFGRAHMGQAAIPARTKRDESSWLLEDEGSHSNRRDTRDSRDFGGRDRNEGQEGRSRGFDRFNRVEKDPEWMSSEPDDASSKPARTVDELQRWKERMKAQDNAGKEQPKAPEKRETPAPPEPVEADDGVPLESSSIETSK